MFEKRATLQFSAVRLNEKTGLWARSNLCIFGCVAFLVLAGETARAQIEQPDFQSIKIPALILGGLVEFDNTGMAITDLADSSYTPPSGGPLYGLPGMLQAITEGYGSGTPPWSGTSGFTVVPFPNCTVGWQWSDNLSISTWGGVSLNSSDNNGLGDFLIAGSDLGNACLDGFNIFTPPARTPVLAPWAAAVSGNWSDTTKWAGDVAPNGSGATAVITASTSAASTITLDVPVTLGTLALGSGSATTGYTLSGSNSLTFSTTSNSSPAQISVADGTHSMNAPIILASNLVVTSTSSNHWTLALGDSGGVTDNGNQSSLTMSASNGTLILNGSDSYTGGTTVNTGALIATSSYALPGGTSLTVGAAGTLVFDPSAAAAPAAGAVVAVPEPSTMALLGIGAIIVVSCTWRRRRSRREARRDSLSHRETRASQENEQWAWS